MTASAKKSSSTTRNRAATVDRLALIRAKAEERRAAKAEREAFTAHLDAQEAAEDAQALGQCHVILDRMSIRGAAARTERARQNALLPSRKRARLARAVPATARETDVLEGKGTFRDPYDATTFITTTVNRRVDVLAAERAAGRITEAQFLVGRTLQALWEKQLGVRTSGGTWDSTTTPRDHASILARHADDLSGMKMTVEDIRMRERLDTAHRVQASNERAAQVIGDSGVRFLRAILAEGHSFGSYAEARGRGTGDRASSDVAKRFRWLLEELTEEQHTARAPGAAPVRDGYADQAAAIPERLERSAALAAEATAE